MMTSHFGPWRLYTSAELYESREGGGGPGGGGGLQKKPKSINAICIIKHNNCRISVQMDLDEDKDKQRF